MRTKTISIYKFEELSEKAQAKVLEDHRGYYTDDSYLESDDCLKEALSDHEFLETGEMA